MNGVRQCAVLLKLGEHEQQLPHFVYHAAGQQSACANQRVAAPVEKPRIAGDNRFAFVTADDEVFCRVFELAGEITCGFSAFRFRMSVFDFFRFRRQHQGCVGAFG